MIINLATPAQREQFLDGMKRGAKPKAYKPPPQLVRELMLRHEDGFELQLPIVVHAQHGYAQQARMAKNTAKKKQMARVLDALRLYLRGIDRSRVERITFTRVSLGKLDPHDNLPYAFKHVVDVTCAWVVCGDEEFDWKRVGKFDDQLTTRQPGRVTWTYEQRTNDDDRTSGQRKKPQGIRIRFHIG